MVCCSRCRSHLRLALQALEARWRRWSSSPVKQFTKDRHIASKPSTSYMSPQWNAANVNLERRGSCGGLALNTMRRYRHERVLCNADVTLPMNPVAPVMNTSLPAKYSGMRGGAGDCGTGRGTILILCGRGLAVPVCKAVRGSAYYPEVLHAACDCMHAACTLRGHLIVLLAILVLRGEVMRSAEVGACGKTNSFLRERENVAREVDLSRFFASLHSCAYSQTRSGEQRVQESYRPM